MNVLQYHSRATRTPIGTKEEKEKKYSAVDNIFGKSRTSDEIGKSLYLHVPCMLHSTHDSFFSEGVRGVGSNILDSGSNMLDV